MSVTLTACPSSLTRHTLIDKVCRCRRELSSFLLLWTAVDLVLNMPTQRPCPSGNRICSYSFVSNRINSDLQTMCTCLLGTLTWSFRLYGSYGPLFPHNVTQGHCRMTVQNCHSPHILFMKKIGCNFTSPTRKSTSLGCLDGGILHPGSQCHAFTFSKQGCFYALNEHHQTLYSFWLWWGHDPSWISRSNVKIKRRILTGSMSDICPHFRGCPALLRPC